MNALQQPATATIVRELPGSFVPYTDPEPEPDVSTQLCRAAAGLRQAAVNQDLLGLRIMSRRLHALARATNLGPLIWHAAAVDLLVSKRPNSLGRLAQLLDGLEVALEAALEKLRAQTC